MRTPSLIIIGLFASGVMFLPLPATAQNAPAQAQGAAQSSSGTASPAAVNNLLQAAQQLRDATHDLAREKDANNRAKEIRAIDQTLLQVQNAMDSLPSNLLLARPKESVSDKAARRMAKAADRLNKAANALQNANAKKTQASLAKIQKALKRVREERTQIAGVGGQQPTERPVPLIRNKVRRTSVLTQQRPSSICRCVGWLGLTEARWLPRIRARLRPHRRAEATLRWSANARNHRSHSLA